jgi:hypothetical protein
VNNKANTFLNAFGAGRSEVSIGGLSSKKLNYSLRTIQPISELDANSLLILTLKLARWYSKPRLRRL